MNASANINIKFSSQQQLKSLVDALSPELDHSIGSRANVNLVCRNRENLLSLKIDAENTTALRSTLNAYLRWISSITNLIEFVDCS